MPFLGGGDSWYQASHDTWDLGLSLWLCLQQSLKTRHHNICPVFDPLRDGKFLWKSWEVFRIEEEVFISCLDSYSNKWYQEILQSFKMVPGFDQISEV